MILRDPARRHPFRTPLWLSPESKNHLLRVYDCVTMRPVMFDLKQAQQVCGDVGLLLRLLLLCLLFFRSNVRYLPFFFSYLCVNLLQAVVVYSAYNVWGDTSAVAFKVAWGSQALVLCARALAVAELCRLLLAGHRGVWSLAWRALLSCAVLVLLYSALVSKHQWSLALFGANRALELTIAAVIVALFVFLRHYRVAAEPTVRNLALGFCLYSCFAVLNNTVLELLPKRYFPLWNFLDVVTFLACLLVWTWALRNSIPRLSFGPMPLPGSVYRQLSPEINLRLRLLNERLRQFWKIEAPRI